MGKRITGLYSEDPPATFTWADHHGYEQKTLGDIQAINALVQMDDDKTQGLVEGEDIGMDVITMDGHTVDLRQTKKEKKLEQEAEKARNSWVNNNDKADTNPELIRFRKHLKKGVLSYSDYMDNKLGLK